MAIIKCPECGRQISDMAPVCPNCGVEIAGKIVKCSHCGEVYLKDHQACPICHTPTPFQHSHPESAVPPPVEHQPTIPTGQVERPQPLDDNQQPRKRVYGVLITVVTFVALVVALFFYFKTNTEKAQEQQAYEVAMRSNDPSVMQNYIDTNPDAPQEHLDSVRARLDKIKVVENDWNNAVVSGSKEALLDFLQKYPESTHKVEAQLKIDSLDWKVAQSLNTLEGVQSYIDAHPNGRYLEDANEMLKTLKASTVQPEEKQAATAALRRFFQAINERNENKLLASVSGVMTNFLDKSDATGEDVLSFMHKIYKEGITNMNWRLGSDIQVDKKEVGDEIYTYFVQCSVTQQVESTDATKSGVHHYRVKATVSPDGLLSSFGLVRIIND